VSLAALDRLQACHEELIGALDGLDVDAIENSIVRFRGAIEEVRALGGWRDNPQMKSRAQHIARLAAAAQGRVNFLTDLNRHRIDALDAARGQGQTACYGRDGGLAL
jgi:hypothetical protein